MTAHFLTSGEGYIKLGGRNGGSRKSPRQPNAPPREEAEKRLRTLLTCRKAAAICTDSQSLLKAVQSFFTMNPRSVKSIAMIYSSKGPGRFVPSIKTTRTITTVIRSLPVCDESTDNHIQIQIFSMCLTYY